MNRQVKIMFDKVFILDRSEEKKKWIIKAVDNIYPLKLRRVGSLKENDALRNIEIFKKLEFVQSESTKNFLLISSIAKNQAFNYKIFINNINNFCKKHDIPISGIKKIEDEYELSFSKVISLKKAKKLYKYLKKYSKSYKNMLDVMNIKIGPEKPTMSIKF